MSRSIGTQVGSTLHPGGRDRVDKSLGLPFFCRTALVDRLKPVLDSAAAFGHRSRSGFLLSSEIAVHWETLPGDGVPDVTPRPIGAIGLLIKEHANHELPVGVRFFQVGTRLWNRVLHSHSASIQNMVALVKT